MNQPLILCFNSKDWALRVSLLLQQEIQEYLEKNGKCSIVLTGGKTALQLYRTWSQLDSFKSNHNIAFYFGDERCVAPMNINSNYNLAMKSLFIDGVPAGCSVFRMEADECDIESAVRKYEEMLPESPDILLLGVGEDGHVASLFSESSALLQMNHKVTTSHSSKFPFKRMTITPKVIAAAKSLYLLACGQAKGRILASALSDQGDFLSNPVRLTLSGNWLIDNEAVKAIY
jgi:6-phosphogluconolactonase